MELKEIAGSHWNISAATRALADLIRCYLNKTDGKPLSSSDLYFGLGAELEQIKSIGAHASQARKAKLLDGYWETAGKGAYGKSKIVWHAKAIPAITGNASRDKILAALNENARPAMLAYFAEEDKMPARPIRTREQQRDFIRNRFADKPDVLASQEVIWKAQDAGVVFEPQSKENDNRDDDDWLNET